MALYVKDEEVDRLAREVQAAYGVKTKTEAGGVPLLCVGPDFNASDLARS